MSTRNNSVFLSNFSYFCRVLAKRFKFSTRESTNTMKKLFLNLILCLLTFSGLAQDDPVLFTVAGKPVHVSEFTYIYQKTNGDKADFSKESLEEYLDLYKKFKLKVQRARDMKLDTVPALQKELEGYRRQLADSYLMDKEVTERLVKEVYERQKRDLKIAHILIKVENNDTTAAYQKAMDVKKKITKRMPFEKVAMSYSDDQNSKENGGEIGYITAMLPSGFYGLESAVYSLGKGEVSDPVRTRMGYHLLKVLDNRPARGEIEVAHILIRIPKEGKDAPKAKQKIDSIYQLITGGTDFGGLAKQLSEDKVSASKSGYLGAFGINKYERSFEDAAFALQKDGDISAPVQTAAGWHIIKRIGKKEMPPYDLARRNLQNRVKRDERFELARVAMVNRIKEEANYKVNENSMKDLLNVLDASFLTPKWEAPASAGDKVLFSLGKNAKYTVGEFLDYCKSATRIRFRGGSSREVKKVAGEVFNQYVEEKCLKFEEQRLEEKYPDFKSLMREYEEGILLFEATKQLVWDRASQDTSGLNAYFQNIQHKYKWAERAEVVEYTLDATAADRIDEVRKQAQKNTPDKVLAKFNTDDKIILTVTRNKYEKGKNKLLNDMPWKIGRLTSDQVNKRDKSVTFMKIENILKPQNKTLKEARGYAVADYQDHLERAWIKELEKQYPIKVYQRVFNKLVK